MDDVQANLMQWAAEQLAYQVDAQMTNPAPVERDWKAERLARAVPTDLFCPYCGEKRVVVEPGDGDYYQGPAHDCLACGETFHL